MEYNIIFVDLPIKIKGICSVDCEGFYTIYINLKLSSTEQQRAIEHELQHYKQEHFYSFEKLKILEKV